MSAVSGRGGVDAIAAAEALVRHQRDADRSSWLELDQITGRLRLALEQVLAEAGLWAPELGARALRQAEGDVAEAVHLLRSHRASLPRFGRTLTVSTDDLAVLRRIVPAYRNPPGPQLLGRTVDYAGRLIDLTPEDEARATAAEAAMDAATEEPGTPPTAAGAPAGMTRLSALLREQDLLVDRRRGDDPEPHDITRTPVGASAARSARLSILSRAETGAVVHIWYRAHVRPGEHGHSLVLGEVRYGRIPVRVAHPRTGDAITIGAVPVTEVEAIEDLDRPGEDVLRFDAGYGLCLGHNERKTIAAAALDIELQRSEPGCDLEQAVLHTTDGLDANGLISHLKLPHYVGFRSSVERKRARRQAADTAARMEAGQ